MTIQEIVQQLLSLDMTKQYDYTIKEYKNKRSLNANSYAWCLITKIGNALSLSKDEVYKQMLRDYGQPKTDSEDNPILVSVKSHINLLKQEDMYCKFVGNGQIGEEVFNHYMLLRGSSEFDTKEMSIFIDGVVQEAQALEIETLTPNMLMEMKGSWDE